MFCGLVPVKIRQFRFSHPTQSPLFFKSIPDGRQFLLAKFKNADKQDWYISYFDGYLEPIEQVLPFMLTPNLGYFSLDVFKGSSQNRVKIFYLYNVKIRGREGV